ncbi:hypothetical protein KCTC52924_01988 [Arenibacter antarcticus]|uniref:DUF4138 domain-containing protein n=1 Tax=Arenibacter antarcticus TaxID=2040469 RepID=A0ABW5VGH9_9FLAO|nr:DUF4138 domain-containing protein [Arenibacter sp. H213]MCM4168415.1 conjugal transfer protein [Arenibacter sp. H213]
MRNSITFISLFSVLSFTQAQNSVEVDTIFANEQKTVSMFFPKPIRQGITGSSNYAFSYNREKEQYFGLLQAMPGKESNLLVVTSDGEVYSYLLRYSEKLNRLNYFIPASKSIGNERSGLIKFPMQKTSFADSDTFTNPSKTLDYPKLCSQLLRNPRPFHQIKKKKGISIRMTKSIYYSTDVYIIFEISNSSGIDYEINSLILFKVNGNKRRKASYQELPLSPIVQFNMPQVVPKGQAVEFVFVYPKFTLGAHEKLLVKLDELNGARDVVLGFK